MPRALIVDDKPENLYLLAALLSGNGYLVDQTSNGIEALAAARTHPPDLIISDILMPGMDGFALCRQWKQNPQLRSIPFVFYTATYTDPKDEQFARSLGADLFLVKPQEPDVFMGQIAGVLRQQKAGQLLQPSVPVIEESSYLREYNATLIHKLEDKLVQLERANEVRNALIGSVSHELRTPLTPVTLLVDLLADDPDTSPYVREHLEIIRSHVEIEKHLISDLLDYAAMQSGCLSLHREPLSLHSMLRQMAANWREQIEAKALRLDLHLEAPFDQIAGDRKRLEQVLWNLMHNAIRRSPGKGAVSFHSRGLPDQVALDVWDTGKAMDAETVGWVFAPFEHSVRVGDARAQGIGLGLAISKDIVETHGGSMSIQSKEQPRATIVTVQLPIYRSQQR
jgi:signal transduction histidine kinase